MREGNTVFSDLSPFAFIGNEIPWSCFTLWNIETEIIATLRFRDVRTVRLSNILHASSLILPFLSYHGSAVPV